MEDIIRERIEALHQDLDSLNTEAAALALGGEARDRQVIATTGAIEALEAILERAPKPKDDLGPIRVYAEGAIVGNLRGYSIQELPEAAPGTFVQITLRVLASHESVAMLTREAAARSTLVGRVAKRTPGEEAHALLQRAGNAADEAVLAGDRDAEPPSIFLNPETKRLIDTSAGTTFRAFKGQFGSFSIRVDEDIEPGTYRIVHADDTESAAR